MNWFNRLRKTASDAGDYLKKPYREIKDLRQVASAVILWSHLISNAFPKAKFQTSLMIHGMDKRKKHWLSFVVFANDLQSKEAQSQFKLYDGSTKDDLTIEGFVRPNGYDPMLYKLYESKFVPAEKTEIVKITEQTSGSAEILEGQLQYNVFDRIVEPYEDWRKFAPQLQNTLKKMLEEDMSIEDAETMLKKVAPNLTTAFRIAFRDWWWSHRPQHEHMEAFEKNLESFYAKNPVSQFEFDPATMTIENGKGKYLNAQTAAEAYAKFGDFRIVVKRVNGDREIVNVSEYLAYKKSSDDEAFDFWNRGGGVREIWVAG